VNDVRRYEDLPPVEGGDVNRVPLANVDLAASNLTELNTKSVIAQRMIQSGFDPMAVLEALGLPSVPHTGLPSVQLQQIAQIDPENPAAAYQVDEA
jgi:hypothetical protein